VKNESELDEDMTFLKVYNKLVKDSESYGLSTDDIVYQFLRNVLEPVCDLKAVYTKNMLAINFGCVDMTISLQVDEKKSIDIEKNFKCLPISFIEHILVKARKRFALLKEKALESEKRNKAALSKHFGSCENRCIIWMI
jgi:hypothetical protein